jgi:hypothetical protein
MITISAVVTVIVVKNNHFHFEVFISVVFRAVKIDISVAVYSKRINLVLLNSLQIWL